MATKNDLIKKYGLSPSDDEESGTSAGYSKNELTDKYGLPSTGDRKKDLLRKYGIAKIDNDPEYFINLYMQDYNDFYRKWNSAAQSAGWTDAMSGSSQMQTEYGDLQQRSGAIRDYLDKNREWINRDYYDNVMANLETAGSGYQSLQDYYNYLREYYGQWGSQDEYDTWMRDYEAQKEADAQYDLYQQNKKRLEELKVDRGSRNNPEIERLQAAVDEYEAGIWGAEGHVADAKRYLTQSNTPASDGLTASQREQRLKEIENQIINLRTENASFGPGMSYESTVNIDRKKQENNQKISELEEEKKSLILAGSTTEREYLERKREFARQDYSDAVGEALSKAKVGPSESLSAIQSAGSSAAEANAEVLRTTDLIDWLDYVDKYAGKKYDDNFFGQYAANRTIGRMSQDSSLFWNAYLDDPSEENRRMAETADELIERFSLINSETLADDGTLSWISKDLANYMPQFWDQLKYQAGGALLGASATLGNPWGAKAGYVAGSSLYGFQTMRGAAFRELIKAGVDENTARAAAMDESIISSIIEAGDAVIDLFTMGSGKVIDILTDGGATALKKAATTAAGKNAVTKLISGLGKYLLNAGGEYVEESTQEAVSIANQDRDTNGIWDLAGRALKTYLLMFSDPESKDDQEKKEQLQEAGEGGLRLGLMLGGAEIVGNATVGKAVRNAQAELAVGALRPQLQDLTAKALELNPEDKAALRVQERMDSGKKVSGMDIYNMLISYEGSVQEKDAGIVQEAAASRLEALGETGDVNTIAAAIAKQITGQDLTRNERLAIKDSKYWQRVANELNPENMDSGDYSSDWAREYDALRDVTQQYSRDLSGVTADQDAQNIAARLIRDGVTAQDANKTAKQLSEDSKLYGKQSKVYTDTYIPGQDTTQYKLQYAQVYRMGQEGIDRKYVAEYSKGLTDSQRDVIYSAGRDSVRDKQRSALDLDTDDLDVNADGKTLRQDTGDEIQLGDFDTTGTLKTSGGGSVDLSRISFASMDDAVLYSTISKVSSSASIANSLLRQFRGQSELSAIDFAAGLMEAYDAGRIGDVTLKELENSEFAGKLNVAQREAAYNRGKRMGYQDAYRRQQDVKKKSGGKKDGKLHFERNGRKFDSVRESSLAVMDTLAKTLGVDIYVFESYVNKEGKRVYLSDSGEKKAPNGYYDPSDGSIHIDLNAGQSGKGTMLFTVAHELTHFIKDWSSVKYRALADSLVKQYQKRGVTVSELVDNQIAKAKLNGREISRQEAFDEVVADSMESMLSDENAAAFLEKLAKRDKGLKEKVVSWLKDLAAKLKNALTAYKDVKPDSPEGKMVAEMEDFRNEIMGIYTSALVDAGENFRENGGNLTSDGDYLYSGRVTDNAALDQAGIYVDEKTESVVPSLILSERTWTESDYIQNRDQAARDISNAIGISVKKAKKYIDDVNSIAKMIADDRTRLDYFSSPGRSSFVSNVEYGGSFDFSTLCKKRRLLTGTFTAIQKALPNTALTANEILEIRNRMKEAGLEVSCGLCYVEGSRSNMGQFAKEFLRLYKQYYPDSWQPNMADVNTPDGIEWVRINHPEVYEQYEYFWNHYGKLKPEDKNLFASQQKPKLYQLHTEYNGEILKNFRNDNRVEEKNRNGGIRLQSFSDFEIVHLIDTMQIIMDMSRVGLAGQAYTKVSDFAWALGDTGLKINLSLIAKGVDQNGKLIFDDVEGMQFEEAMRLRSRYSKNVGTILVVFNDEQLYAAMADDRIDFIIPFHRSQWKKSQYSAMGLPVNTKDYTYMQNEKYIRPQYHEYRGHMVRDKATNYMPNEYWDFGKTGKENAEAYLDLCARNNKRPKFYKLLKDNGDGSYSLKDDGSTDGYWKLLIDFKMYDNDGNGSPQAAVKPDFNMEESRRMLNDYRGGHSSFPAANGIVDQFVSEYKESHKGVQFSDRDSDGRQLSEGQREYFKDSVVRDDDGMLIPVYHSTYDDFHTFKRDKLGGVTLANANDASLAATSLVGHWFSDHDVSDRMGGHPIKCYLKITKPYRTDLDSLAAEIGSYTDDLDKMQEHFENGQYNLVRKAAADFVRWLRSNGYDGLIVDDRELGGTSYVVLNSKQAKLTTNENPTGRNDIRFSDRDPTADATRAALEKENGKLRDDVSRLRELLRLQGKVTGGTVMKQSSIEAAARWLNKYAGARADVKEISGMLKDFYSFLATDKDYSWEDVRERAMGIARVIQGNVQIKPQISDYARDVLREVRGIKITLNEQQRAEVERLYGSYEAFRKAAWGTVTFVKEGGIPLDSQWQEWSTMFPGTFDSEINSNDQPSALLDAIDALRNSDTTVMEYAYNREGILQDIMRAVYDSYWRVDALVTVADRGQKTINDLKAKQGEKVQDLKGKISEKNARINQLRAEHRAEMDSLKEQQKQTVAELKQKRQEDIKKLRTDYRKKLEETRTRYQESREKAVDSRNRAKMREQVKKTVNELNHLLLDGDKKRHVPESMRKAVAEILSAVNMETSTAEARSAAFERTVARYNKRIKLENDPTERARLEAARDAYIGQGDQFKAKIDALAKAYEDIKESADPGLQDAYSDAVSQYLFTLETRVGDTRLGDMTLDQLKTVQEVLRIVLSTIRNANKSFLNERAGTIEQQAKRCIFEVSSVWGKKKEGESDVGRWLRGFHYRNLKPIYLMRAIGSNALTEAYNNLRRGEDTWYRDIQGGRGFFLSQSGKYGYGKWDFEKTSTFTDDSGGHVKLTLGQIMSLYAYSKREAAAEHLRLGGVVIEGEAVRVNKLGMKVTYHLNDATSHQLWPETMAEIIGTLTKEQMAFVDAMQDYLSTVMADKGNEVSLAMYGIKLFNENNYFPIKSAKQFVDQKNEPVGEVKLKNSGFTNKTVPKANNPMVLRDFMDVWADHVNEMSTYHAFVLAIEDFNRIINYQTARQEEIAPVSLKQTIQNYMGQEAASAVRELIQSVNGGARVDPAATFVSKAINLFKKNSVFASASVVIQQPSAIVRAAALIDPKYFVGKIIDREKVDHTWDIIKKYAPVAGIKDMGYFDTNIGKSTVDYIKGPEHDGIKDVLTGIVKREKGSFDELLSMAPGYADKVTWCAIWEAVKRETAAKNPNLATRSEEFLKICGDRFTEVITQTQVYDSVFARSGNMRSKDKLMGMATSFMAEPTTAINMIYDAVLQGTRGDKAYMRRAIGAVVGAAVLNAVLKSIVYAERDDDDDETFGEKYVSALVAALKDDVLLLVPNSIPFVRDIMSIVQGYSVERMDMELADDLISAVKKLYSDKATGEEKILGILGSFGNLLFPAKNMIREVKALINAIDTFRNSESKTAMGIHNAVREGLSGKTVSNARQLYEARMAGDTAHEERVAARYENEKSADSAVVSAIREAFMAGDLSEDEARKHLILYGNTDAGDAYWKLKEWIYAKDKGTTDGYGKYNDLYDAILAGGDIQEAVEEFTENGYDEDEVMSNVKTQVGRWFWDEESETRISAEQASDILEKYFGMKQGEIQETILKWSMKKETGISFDGLREAYLEQIVSESDAITYLQKYGGMTEYDARERVDDWNFEQEHGYAYDDIKSTYLDDEITRAEAIDVMVEIGGKTRDEAKQKVAYWDYENKTGVDYDNKASQYKRRIITRQQLKAALIALGDYTDEDADIQIEVYDWQQDGLQAASFSRVEKWHEYCEPAGVSKSMWLQIALFSANTTNDVDSSGNTVRYSAMKNVMAKIDALPITAAQKTAIAKAIGWSDKNIAKYKPW